VSIERIARDLGTSAASVEAATDALGAAGWLDRDEGGRITGAAGLSLSSGAHRVEIGGRGGDDLRDDFCTPTVLRCSEVHGREWGHRRADHGQRWAGCARAARRLGHAE